MSALDVREPAAPAPPAWHRPAVARLALLHLRSRHIPFAFAALLACGVVLWAALAYHWWLGTGNGAYELPMLIESCAAAIIAVTVHSPFGEPERATGRWLPFLRLGSALILCAAAIGMLAAGAAVAYDPHNGVALAGGVLAAARNVMGFTGVGLICSLVIGGLLSWVGPLCYGAVCQFALIAGYSEPLTWASRPPADRGGWVCAMAVFGIGLAAFTIRGARIRPSAE